MELIGYLFNDKEYFTISDIARLWYPNTIGGGMSTKIKQRTLSLGLKVHQITAKVTHGKRTKNYQLWAIEQKDYQEIYDNFFPGNCIKLDEIDLNEDCGKCIFYIIQKYPKHAPQIIKMGRTTRTAEARMKEYNVFNPELLLKKNISLINEKTLIQMIAGENEALGEEEFWINDLEAFKNRANTVLDLLPDL